MNRNALLIVAHGSRKASSNDEVIAVVAQVKETLGDRYSSIHAAFLELADPSIEDGIKTCLLEGAKSIVILPYFLALGKHVSSDIPEIIRKQQQLYPDVDIVLTEHLGSQVGITKLLADVALENL